jgi:DNA-binding HxlR family transcriptional regulator
MAERDDIASDILQDVAYLSRTGNRLVVLEALVEEPRSTRELREATEISKATINRTLNEFEERSWARRTSDGTYEATPQAEHVAFQLRAFVDSMEAIASLGEDVGVLPVEELTVGPDDDLTVGLYHFADATVERQRPHAQGVGRTRMLEATREASSMDVLTDTAPPRRMGELLQERAQRGDLPGTTVWTAELFDYLRAHPEEPPRWRDVIEGGRRLYHYDGEIAATLFVTDEVTLVWGVTGEMRRRVLVSEDETVRMWARDMVARYRERAEAVDPRAFA